MSRAKKSNSKKKEETQVGCLLVALLVIGVIIVVALSMSGNNTGALLGVFLIPVISIVLSAWYLAFLTKSREEEEERRQELEEQRRRWEEEDRQKKLEEGLKSLGTCGSIDNISGGDFEVIVSKLFSKMGYLVSRTKGSGDEGIDLYLKSKEGRRAGVQCKRWKGIVGQSVVRGFYGSLMHAHLKKGYVVTTGKFSKPAKDFVRGKPIVLIDGDELRRIIVEGDKNKEGKKEINV